MKMTTQKEFFRRLSNRTKYSQRELMEIWDDMLDLVEESVNYKDESKTIIPGLGNIYTKPLRERKARNPKTGHIIFLEPSRKITFRLLPSVKKRLNKKPQ